MSIKESCEFLSKPPLPAPKIIPSYISPINKVKYNELKQNLNVCIYVWMNTGKHFWMHPTKINDNNLIGYIWKDDSWQLDSINWGNIDNFYS